MLATANRSRWNARCWYKCVKMFPSCGWSHCKTLVGTGPRFKRPISCRASRSRSIRGSSVKAVTTRLGPKRFDQFGGRHVQHADKREQVFLVGQRMFQVVAVNHRRQQVRAAFELDQPLRIRGSGPKRPRPRPGPGRARWPRRCPGPWPDRETPPAGPAASSRDRGHDLRQPLGQGHGQFAAVGRRPHARCVDARAPAVGRHRGDHQIEIIAPGRGLVGPEHHLAVAGAVNFDPRVAQPGPHRRARAEHHRRAALPQDHARPVVPRRIKPKRRLRESGLRGAIPGSAAASTARAARASGPAAFSRR